MKILIFRWSLVVIVCLGFGFGISSYFDKWVKLEAGKDKYLRLQRQSRMLLSQIKENESRKVKVLQMRQLARQAKAADLSGWIKYPLEVEEVFDWQAVKKLLLLASNRSKAGGYMFQSDYFKVKRIVDVKKGTDSRAGEDISRVDIDQEAVIKYDISLKGFFLLPYLEK